MTEPTESAADQLLRLCEEELAGCCGRHCHRCGLFKALRVLVETADKSLPRVQHTLEVALDAARKTEG